MKIKNLIKILTSATLVSVAFSMTSCGTSTTDSSDSETSTTTTTTSDSSTDTTDQDAVDAIDLSEDGTTVTSDFTVVTTSSDEDVTWTSGDSDVIAFHEVNSSMYACVTRPSESETVTLTATVGEATKDFSVTVSAVTAEEIAEDYSFTESDSVVAEDFELATSYDYVLSNTYDGDYATDTASISWASSNTDLISISDGKASVTTTNTKTAVTLTATFTYNSETYEEEYTVYDYSATVDATSLETYYENVGSSDNTLLGYVVAVAGYNDTYGEASFYMLDYSLEGGYYVYGAYMDEDTYDSLEYGTRVEVTDVTSTTYNGMIETHYGCTATVITDDNVLSELDSSYTYESVDNMVCLSSVFESLESIDFTKKTGTLVSLTSWQVQSCGTVSTDSDASTTQTLVTLVKEDITISIVINSNVTDLSGDTASSLLSTVSGLNAGDYVDITGVLSYYNGWQIIADSSSSITASSDDSNASIADALAISQIIANIAISDSVSEDSTVDTTTFDTGSVAVTYALEDTYSSVTLVDGVLTFTPTSTLETVVLDITISYGDTSFTIAYSIACQTGSEDEKDVEAELSSIDIDEEYSDPESVELSTSGSTYTDVSLSYALNDDATNAYLETVDGLTYLVIIPSADAETVKLTITATLNDTTETSTVEITIDAYTLSSLSDASDGSLTTGDYYYVSGVVDSIETNSYGYTTVYIKSSSTSDDAFEIYGISDVYGNDYDELDSDSEYYFTEGETVVFYGTYGVYNDEYELKNTTIVSVTETPVTAADLIADAQLLFDEAYYDDATVTLPDSVSAEVTSGSTASVSGSEVTITPSDTSDTVELTLSATVDSVSATGTVTFTTLSVSDSAKANYEIENFTTTETFTGITEESLPSEGTKYTSVSFSYSLSDSTYAYIYEEEGEYYLFVNPSDTTTTTILYVTATSGDSSVSTSITLTIDAYSLENLSDAIDGSLTEYSYYYVSGVVTSISTNSYGTTTVYIAESSTSTDTFEIYDVSDLDGISYDEMDTSSDYYFAVGDTVVFYGEYGDYYGTYELEYATIVSVSTSASNLLDSAEALFSSEYSDTTIITLPSGVEATVTSGSDVVTVSGSTVTITPTSTSTDVELSLSATGWDTTATGTVTFTTELLTDTEKVEAELAAIDIESSYTESTGIDLSTSGSTYEDVTLSYALSNNDSDCYISTDSGEAYLVIVQSSSNQTFTLTITATLNDVTKTSTISITVYGYSLSGLSDAINGSLTTGESYYVSGVVTSIYTTSSGVTIAYIAESSTSTDTFEIYDIYDMNGYSYDELDSSSDYYFAVGDTVVFYGEYGVYNNTYELEYAVIFSVTETPETAESIVSDAADLFSSYYLSSTTVTLPEYVTAAVTSGSTASVSDSVVTITPTSTMTEVVLKLTANYDSETATAEVEFATYLGALATFEYTGDSTNVDDGTDITALITDSDVFTAVAYKNSATTKFGLYKNSLRLYNDSSASSGETNGCSLSISCSDDYTISYIIITYDTSKTGGYISVDGTAEDAISSSHTTDTISYSTTTTSTTIQNTSTIQVRIATIQIIYTTA